LAEILTIEGQEYKKRSPFGVWGLGIITLGVYGFVWYFKINDEARRFLKDDAIRPGVSVLAFIPGFLLVVPPYVSVYRTGTRIVRMEEKAGTATRTIPLLGLILAFIVSLYVPYYQSQLNKVWEDAAARGNAAGLPPADTGPGPAPPA
jgi:hypothetical protein